MTGGHSPPGGGARHRAGGFTLLELLIALTIMSVAMTVVVAAFVATLKGWRKGSEMLDRLHHGDFVMEQLVSALRSTAFFVDAPQYYGFWLEDLENGPYPTDVISFVTSGTAFIPMDSPLVNSLHRIRITVEEDDEGDLAVAINAMPHLMDPEEWEEWEEDGWFVSTMVRGLNCRVYNMEAEDWEDLWEDTNAIPSLVEISLFMDPLEEGESPVVLSRVVEIPVAPLVENAVQFREEDAEDRDIAREEIEAAEGGGIPPGGGTGGRGDTGGGRGGGGNDRGRGGDGGRGGGNAGGRGGAGGGGAPGPGTVPGQGGR